MGSGHIPYTKFSTFPPFRMLIASAYCPKTRTKRISCGFSIIVAQQTTESLTGTDGAFIWKFCEFWLDDLVLQTLMVSFGVVMQGELTNSATQRRFSEKDHPLYAGFFDAPNEP